MKSVAIAGSVAITVAMTGCAQEPPPQTVKQVVVYRTKDSFCQVMTGLFPATGGRPRWSIRDAPETIRDATDLEAAVAAKKCKAASRPTS